MSQPVPAGAADAAAVMECRICWQVYDPSQGDELGQIAPGTPFQALPADWCCPNCDAAKEFFLLVE
ncbi:MAG: rubredoxin [Thiohalocapsa sp.]